MFANWTEMTSSTGGAGNLTLAAVTGAPTFQNVWGSSGARLVSYTAAEWASSPYDGPPAKAESGLGSFDLATGVLTRTKRLSTWDGATYATVSPSALSFGTDPTKIRVMIAPVGDLGPATLPFVLAASPAENLGIPSAHHAWGNNVYTFTANREVYVPLRWHGCGTLVQAGIAVTGAVAGSGVKAALYALASSGLPGERILDINGAAPWDTAATGIKTTSLGAWLPPGWYWMGLLASGAVFVRAADGRFLPNPAGTASSGQAVAFIYATGTYATGLPTTGRTSGLTAATAQQAPILYLKPSN